MTITLAKKSTLKYHLPYRSQIGFKNQISPNEEDCSFIGQDKRVLN